MSDGDKFRTCQVCEQRSGELRVWKLGLMACPKCRSQIERRYDPPLDVEAGQKRIDTLQGQIDATFSIRQERDDLRELLIDLENAVQTSRAALDDELAERVRRAVQGFKPADAAVTETKTLF